MPAKLKNLKVHKVDFVDAGANPAANVMLYKNKDGTPAGQGENSAPLPSGSEGDGVLKRLFTALAKGLGLQDEAAITEIVKNCDAVTFGEKMSEVSRREVTEQIWSICYALEESLCSIICDDDVEEAEKPGLMEQSLEEFNAAVKEFIPAWVAGKITSKIDKSEQPMTPERIENIKNSIAKLEAMLERSSVVPSASQNADGAEPAKTMKGATKEMKIDKSKLSPEELAALEAIEKKAGIEDEPVPSTITPEGVAKGEDTPPNAADGGNEEGEDIYKGLHPAIKAELERMRKSLDDVEDKELLEVAKKYEIIGKKPEELAPVLKNLKAAGGNAYDQMITILDASVTAVEKSGIFSEIGKAGVSGTNDAWIAIEKHADEIQKSMPDLTRAQAIEKACDHHPDLVAEYENVR